MPELLEPVVQSGDRIASLEALRNKLANAIDLCESARDIAALSRQLTEVIAQIADLRPVQKAGDPVDEIAARRASRRPGASAG